MSIRLAEQIEVPQSSADCFRYLADFSTTVQWDPSVVSARKLTAGLPRVGTQFSVQLSFLGREVTMDYRLTELEPNRLLQLQGSGPGFSAADEIRLSPTDRGTRIEYSVEIEHDGAGAKLAALGQPLFQHMGRQSVRGLKRALTPDSGPREARWTTRLADRSLLPGLVGFTRRGYRAMDNKGLTERMDGQQVLVTGPTGGLGLAAACELARLGARVALVGRDADRLQQARQTIIDFSGCEAESISAYEADLSIISEVRRIADELTMSLDQIDVLINNAGALFAEHGQTIDGHERALAINLIAPFILTESLLPALRRSAGRVVNIASGGMYAQALKPEDWQFLEEPYDGTKAYARAKRGLVALTEHWANREPDITVHAMHPGWAATPGVERALPTFNRLVGPWLRDAHEGADTMVWLASAAAPTRSNGQFWLDRQPRPTAIWPGTGVTDRQRSDLLKFLDSVACD